MTPGLYSGITSLNYHTGPGVSKSGLDEIRKSPLHYWHKYGQRQAAPEEAEEREEAEDDAAEPEDLIEGDEKAWQVIGRAMHAIVLEPETFDRRFAIQPKFAGKGAVKAREEWKEQHRDIGIIKPAHLVTINGMRDALAAHPAASKLIRAGQSEQSAYWIDEATGALCRCRPDWLRDDGIIVDLKTCRDASPDGFRRAVANERYHVQAAFYRDGLEAVGVKVRGFVFLTVEKTAPYAVGVYTLDAESVDVGRDEYREDLHRYVDCRDAGTWPGYTTRIETISLPAWRMPKT